jgi:hypothetical protein
MVGCINCGPEDVLSIERFDLYIFEVHDTGSYLVCFEIFGTHF